MSLLWGPRHSERKTVMLKWILKVWCDRVDCINLVQVRNWLQVLVNMVMNLLKSVKNGELSI